MYNFCQCHAKINKINEKFKLRSRQTPIRNMDTPVLSV